MKKMFFLINIIVLSKIHSMEFNNKSNKEKICSLFSFGFCGLNSKDKQSQDDPQAEKIEYLEDIFGTPYNQLAIEFFTTSFLNYLEYFDNHYSLNDLLLFLEKANQKKWMPQFNLEKKNLKDFIIELISIDNNRDAEIDENNIFNGKKNIEKIISFVMNENENFNAQRDLIFIPLYLPIINAIQSKNLKTFMKNKALGSGGFRKIMNIKN